MTRCVEQMCDELGAFIQWSLDYHITEPHRSVTVKPRTWNKNENLEHDWDMKNMKKKLFISTTKLLGLLWNGLFVRQPPSCCQEDAGLPQQIPLQGVSVVQTHREDSLYLSAIFKSFPDFPIGQQRPLAALIRTAGRAGADCRARWVSCRSRAAVDGGGVTDGRLDSRSKLPAATKSSRKKVRLHVFLHIAKPRIGGQRIQSFWLGGCYNE